MLLFILNFFVKKAALFAGELLEAYSAAAKSKGWKFDRLSQTTTDLGGIKEAAVSIMGNGSREFSAKSDDGETDDILSNLGPYGLFRFESGVHRVQRVPVNDSKIQTSACSVAILPSPAVDNTDPASLLPTSELKIETFRASGAGGQHVNTTESAVRITHIPTGVTAAIQDERSQHKNKTKALKLITARVRDRQREEEHRARGDARKGLMGGGDRSERIRTYNFPQDRVTDHRCKHSENGIVKLFSGGGEHGLVEAFAPPMRIMNREELMKQLEDEH
jgi:peptide chain release factor 1